MRATKVDQYARLSLLEIGPHHPRIHLVSLGHQGLFVNFRGVREMLGYLMQDCCQADENDCLAVLDRMFPECCSSNS